MPPISSKKAREMLSQSCKRYIDHNNAQLNSLSIPNKYGEIYHGIDNWLHYTYQNTQHDIFGLEKRKVMEYSDDNDESSYFEEFRFGQIRRNIWNAPLSNPAVLLHNLTAINRLIYHIMTIRNEVSEFGYNPCVKSGDTLTFEMELKKYREEQHRVCLGAEDILLGWYQLKNNELIGRDGEKTSIYQNRVITSADVPMSSSWQRVGFGGVSKGMDEPVNLLLPYMESKMGQCSSLSIEIYNAIENIKSLFDFVNTLPDERIHEHCNGLGLYLEDVSSVLESYLKGLVAKELKATLDDPSLSDEEALKSVEAQLKNPITAAILTKNRQSQSEYYLKMLSLISILIGVGIFTTLGLVFKRLYDSGGSSINFFKPLSRNLVEDVERFLANERSGPGT